MIFQAPSPVLPIAGDRVPLIESGATKIVGGGPRLDFVEWITLVALFHQHEGDGAGLNAALEEASAALAPFALKSAADQHTRSIASRVAA